MYVRSHFGSSASRHSFLFFTKMEPRLVVPPAPQDKPFQWWLEVRPPQPHWRNVKPTQVSLLGPEPYVLQAALFC